MVVLQLLTSLPIFNEVHLSYEFKAKGEEFLDRNAEWDTVLILNSIKRSF